MIVEQSYINNVDVFYKTVADNRPLAWFNENLATVSIKLTSVMCENYFTFSKDELLITLATLKWTVFCCLFYVQE